MERADAPRRDRDRCGEPRGRRSGDRPDLADPATAGGTGSAGDEQPHDPARPGCAPAAAAILRLEPEGVRGRSAEGDPGPAERSVLPRNDVPLGPTQSRPAPIRENRLCGIVPRRAGDAAAGMVAGAAMVETEEGAAVVGVAEHRAGGEELVERERAVEDVAAGEPEDTLEVERRERLAGDDAVLEAGSVALDGGDHEVGDLLAMIVPGPSLRKLRRDVLAEQARDMRALRCQAVVERRGDQHLDHRLAAPAVRA